MVINPSSSLLLINCLIFINHVHCYTYNPNRPRTSLLLSKSEPKAAASSNPAPVYVSPSTTTSTTPSPPSNNRKWADVLKYKTLGKPALPDAIVKSPTEEPVVLKWPLVNPEIPKSRYHSSSNLISVTAPMSSSLTGSDLMASSSYGSVFHNSPSYSGSWSPYGLEYATPARPPVYIAPPPPHTDYMPKKSPNQGHDLYSDVLEAAFSETSKKHKSRPLYSIKPVNHDLFKSESKLKATLPYKPTEPFLELSRAINQVRVAVLKVKPLKNMANNAFNQFTVGVKVSRFDTNCCRLILMISGQIRAASRT